MSDISAQVRKQVQKRANKRCEYCRRPEEFSPLRFQVDHIISVKHGGTSDLINLAWACPKCNNSKGSDVASYDPKTGELAAFYNPRKQNWEDHFELGKMLIVGKTPIGRVTINILQLNHPKQIEIRAILLESDLW